MCERGRVAARVHHSLVQLTLDVPDDDKQLEAHTSYKSLARRDAKGGPVLETLTWATWDRGPACRLSSSGGQSQEAHVCHLTIAVPKFTRHPRRASGLCGYGGGRAQQQGLLNPFPLVVSPATPLLELVLPTVEEVAAVGAKALRGWRGLSYLSSPHLAQSFGQWYLRHQQPVN